MLRRDLWANSLALLAIIFTNAILSFNAFGQVRPVYDMGAAGLDQSLRRLRTSASVMMIGAHPDDEDSGLLAYLARGENARTAYLSLTRGDGGQNLIGPELFEPLGVVRTEELLQARRLDGAEQYFTRAFDFGFSKTLAETQQKWDEPTVLCDAVRAIREFRPMVVISRFTGTPADGHGNHQFAGYISPIAVRAAADGSQCRDAGPAWQVKKFYVSQGFRSTASPKLRLDTGKYDLALGRSYFEIAMQGRSQHKSQEQGVLELKGERFSGLNSDGSAKETDVFDGIDVSVKGIAEATGNHEPTLIGKLAELQAAVDALNVCDTNEKLVSALARGWKAAFDAEWATRQPATKYFLRVKQKKFVDALKLAAGIQIDALADRETVVAGEDLTAAVRVFFPETEKIAVKGIDVSVPPGWTVRPADASASTPQQFARSEIARSSGIFTIHVAGDAAPTQPYWLTEKREGDLFVWPATDSRTHPFDPQLAEARVTVVIDGIEVPMMQPIEFRFADDVRGEVRRELNVVPAITVKLDHELLIVPTGSAATRRVVMTIYNNSSKAEKGTASVDMAGAPLSSMPSSVPFELAPGQKTSAIFTIAIAAGIKAGSYGLTAKAVTADSTSSTEMHTLAYPHIQTHRYYTPSSSVLESIDLKTTPEKVGYVMGTGDAVDEAIRQMGYDVSLLGEDELSTGDLSSFDVIVIGIRAYQVRPDIAASNQRLLDYVKNGGTLLVQYQRADYEAFLPYPAKIGPRVVEENAPVTILEPGHPAFNIPNKITAEDFSGWVQERNLSDLSTFDEHYLPLLESHDSGEAENKGGLVVAKLGKGNFVYCSYSLFRQLPSGVPGAYRLMANLLSVGRKQRSVIQ
jgi:LmbE family N-acetylglucosaminyl deacetylase